MTGHTANPDFGNEPSIFKKDYFWQERSLQLFQTRIDEFYSAEPGRFPGAWVDQVTPSGGKTNAASIVFSDKSRHWRNSSW